MQKPKKEAAQQAPEKVSLTKLSVEQLKVAAFDIRQVADKLQQQYNMILSELESRNEKRS